MGDLPERRVVYLTDGTEIHGEKHEIHIQPWGVEHVFPSPETKTLDKRIIPWHQVKEVRTSMDLPDLPPLNEILMPPR